MVRNKADCRKSIESGEGAHMYDQKILSIFSTGSEMRWTVLLAMVLVPALAMEASKADFTFGTPTRLGQTVNSWNDDYSPCISMDGLSLYFASNRFGGYGNYDIWISTRPTTSEDWDPAENLGPLVNCSEEDVCPAISPDGLELYFTSFRTGGSGGSDIWVTKRDTTADPWGQPENLGLPVNSGADELTPSLSADGLELYFALGRANSDPELSLYVTKRDTKDGSWLAPVRLGPAVNNGTCQWNPAVSNDGLLLFSSDYWDCSTNPDGSNATDIWLTMRATKDSDWIAPVNLGLSVNTAFAEGSPMISPDGSTLYFSSDSYDEPAGWNNLDIWQVPILPVVDFDGDGYVGLTDLQRVADSWGQNDPSCDIGPMPWGDGVVDEVDLEILMDHWQTPESGLVAHWKLDETEGTIAHDSAGISDANLMGDPVWQPDGGMVDGALLFDGVGDYVSAPYVLPNERSFSFFAWVRDGALLQVILSESGMYGKILLQADFVDGSLMTSLGGNEFLYSHIPITDGQWHQVGLVCDADAMTRALHVDGIEVVSATAESVTNIGKDGLFFGASWGLDVHSDFYWSGLIDDVRVYDRAVRSLQQQRFRLPER